MDSEHSKKQLLFKIALALLAIVITLCIYVPGLIYFTQREYFTNYYLELIAAPLLYMSGAALLVWVFLSLLPRTGLKYMSSVLLVLALLIWLQADIFAVSYGALDGSGIEFEPFDQRGLWELIIVLVSVVLAWVFNQFINKHFSLIIGLILLGQCLLTGFNVINEPADKPEIKALDKEFFNYSSKKNVIVIILDTFGGDVFESIIEKYPEFKKGYQGFVSYTDAISNYPATKGSLPSLLTGQMIPKDYELLDFIDEVVSERGLPAHFEEQGYEVSVVSVFSWFRNFYAKRFMFEPPFLPEELKAYNAAMLFDYSLFRVVPHYLKELVYDQGHWLASGRVATHTEIPNTEAERANLFLELMTDDAVVTDEVPRFKLIHVTTPHPKFVYDQDCRKGTLAKKASTRHYMEQQSVCALRKLDALFEKYKALGVYDDALIVVASDHGDRNFDEMSLTGFPSYFEMNSSGILFMIKGIGQKGDFKEVAQPFSLLKLFAALTDASLHHSGYDFLEDLDRPFYAFRNTFIGTEGMLQDAPLYHVTADYKNPGSWHFKEYAINQCKAQKFPVNMVFITTAREQYCGIFGFVPDYVTDQVWTESLDSRVVFNLESAEITNDNTYKVEMTFEPGFPEQPKEIEMTVLFNTKELGNILISDPELQVHTFDIPVEFFTSSGIQELQLLMPDLKSEHQLGVGTMTRKLGVLMKSIKLTADPI